MTPQEIQEIDALVRRLEQSADKVRHTRFHEWADMSVEAALALRSLLAALQKYAQHSDSCATRYPIAGGGAWQTRCDCGLDAAQTAKETT